MTECQDFGISNPSKIRAKFSLRSRGFFLVVIRLKGIEMVFSY